MNETVMTVAQKVLNNIYLLIKYEVSTIISDDKFSLRV